MERGGYVLAEATGGKPTVVLIATGSEVPVARDAARRLRYVHVPAHRRDVHRLASRDIDVAPVRFRLHVSIGLLDDDIAAHRLEAHLVVRAIVGAARDVAIDDLPAHRGAREIPLHVLDENASAHRAHLAVRLAVLHRHRAAHRLEIDRSLHARDVDASAHRRAFELA